MNTPKIDKIALHIGEIADHLLELQRENQILIDSLYAIIEEWEEYFK